MTIQIDENWKHCTIEDFMNLSQEEHRVIYAALEEYHFDIFGMSRKACPEIHV